MLRVWIATAGLLFPLAGMACQAGDRHRCQEHFRALVAYRTQAIEGAFGSLFGVLPAEIRIEFVRSKDPRYARFGGRMGYDVEQQTLIVPSRVLSAQVPNPLRAAAYYWPFYENPQYRAEFPVIEAIDNVLWNAYLQEAASARGLPWPHEGCASVDVGRRLPCEMLISGIAEHIKSLHGPIFNSNRLDRIWPEDFAAFSARVWRTDEEYQEVQRYGGILLTRPLIDEFGVPRTLAYIARTPFKVRGNNLHAAALRYQDRAREVLGGNRASASAATALSARSRYAAGQPASSQSPPMRRPEVAPLSSPRVDVPHFHLQEQTARQ